MNQRRLFLKRTTQYFAGLGLASISRQSIAAMCGLTPTQTSGPFYPGETKILPENDLTQLPGRPRAKGQVIYIFGKVQDTNCEKITNANVEIWQACESGKYNHPNDPNPAKIDENFRYWGETYSDDDGNYMFKTIIPGAYPADVDWVRPPHIHFRIMKLGFKELVTQMYFRDDPRNDDDKILLAIPHDQRDSVIVPFAASASDLEPGSLSGHFDITLMKVR